jgi:hypothetical protein
MSRKAENKRKRDRRNLFEEQNKLCYWCDVPMILPEPYPSGGKLPKNLCTLDHLFDKTHPRRLVYIPGEKRYVASCWECNNKRGRQTAAAEIDRTFHLRSTRVGGCS